MPWLEPSSRYFQTDPVDTKVSGTEIVTGDEVKELPLLSRAIAVNRWTPPTTPVQLALNGVVPSWANFRSSTKNSTFVTEPTGTDVTVETVMGFVF